MLSSRTSRWSAGAVLLSVLILVAAWFLMVGPRRDKAADLNDQTTAANSKADSLNLQIAQLKSEFGDLPQRRAQLAAIQRQLPPGSGMPELVRDLRQYASDAGVNLDSVTPSTPAYYSATGAAAASTSTAQSGQVVVIPVDITITGEYFEDSLFIKYLQTRLERVYLINNLALTSTVTSGGTTTDSGATSTTSTPVATPSPAPSAASSSTDQGSTVAITGEVFVLPAANTSLSDIAKDTSAATSGATAS